MLDFLSGMGKKRRLTGWAKRFSDAVAVVLVIYIAVSVFLYPEAILYRSICFGLFFVGIFIEYAAPGSRTEEYVPVYDFILAGASLSVSIYFMLNIERIVLRHIFVSEVFIGDIVFGIVTIMLLLEGSRRVLGPWLPAFSILSLLYIFFGNHIGGRLGHQGFTLPYVIDGLFLSNYGIWGSTFGVAVGQIMAFMLFASFFQKSGAADFLFDFAASIAGATKGGVAKISVITSALFGMISGGPVTDVTTTGSLTIPAMKKKGYPATMAAAIESCASIGAIFMPPIMGSMAFIMAEVVGIPYGEVARRAFIPAVLYFAVIFFIVDFRSRKLGIEGFSKSERKPLYSLAKRGLIFFVPLIYLSVRLFSGSYPQRVALESIAVILIINLLQKNNLIKLDILRETMTTAVHRGRIVVSTMAACGVFVSIVMITGLTSKLGSFLNGISNYSSLMILGIVVIITVFLGLAMNGTSSYLITAVICAPILMKQGYNPLGVHMFILYFAAMATITPPVAMTTYTAAAIAEAPPLPVSFQAMMIGAIAYILPFAFVYNPSILLYGSVGQTLLSFTSAMAGAALLASAMEKWWFGLKMNILLRGCILTAGTALIIGKIFFIMGALALLSVSFIYTVLYKKTYRDA